MLHLIDLLDQEDGDWDAPKRPAVIREGLRITWDGMGPLVADSPWQAAGEAVGLDADAREWQLPAFRRWLMLVADHRSLGT